MEYLKDMFELNKENRGRCHQHKLVIKHSMAGLRQPFFSRRVVSKWNNLTESITSAETLTSFKNELVEYYRENGLGYTNKWD